jgi:hypothetical protein
MTPARAFPAADFKNCCLRSGQFDGSRRHHFFQGVTPSSNNRWGTAYGFAPRAQKGSMRPRHLIGRARLAW